MITIFDVVMQSKETADQIIKEAKVKIDKGFSLHKDFELSYDDTLLLDEDKKRVEKAIHNYLQTKK